MRGEPSPLCSVCGEYLVVNGEHAFNWCIRCKARRVPQDAPKAGLERVQVRARRDTVAMDGKGVS